MENNGAILPYIKHKRQLMNASDFTRDTIDPARRKLLCLAAAGVTACGFGAAEAATDPAKMLPQVGDVLCFGSHEQNAREVTPDDVKAGAAPLSLVAKDPSSGVLRERSRLGQVLLVRLDPAAMNTQTQKRAAGDVVAYSAICTHAACAVSEWKAENASAVCPCHGSEYDLRLGAKVVAGPAPRALPLLPITLKDNKFFVSGKFTGRVGFKRT